MKNRLIRFVFTMVVLLYIQSASAFYNPSTGRWLSRDPVDDKANVLHAYVTTQSTGIHRSDMMNVYAFCHNSALWGYDYMGLHRSGISNSRRCANACDDYRWAMLQDNPGWMVDGGVVCCGGRKYYCAWGADSYTNAKAKDLILNCIKEHEQTHADDVDCPECDDGRISRPKFKKAKSGRQMYWEECYANTVGESCLWKALQQCGSDLACHSQVQAKLLAQAAAKDYYCGMWRPHSDAQNRN